jgi:glycine/D-amino acid oxidase-like deaminating enzyme
MSDHVDSVVIGVGVISLAVVRLLALRGFDVLVLQAAPTTGNTLAWAANTSQGCTAVLHNVAFSTDGMASS